jgi:ATP-binding protein involved in chromosome partitioning
VIRSMPDAKIIIVSAPNKISAEQAKNTINFFRKEKIQVFGWIENMRGFLCQSCNQRQELFSTGSGDRAIFLMDVPFLGRIPIDPHIEECSGSGAPYLEKYHDSEAAIAFNRIAEKILKLCAGQGTERQNAPKLQRISVLT